MRKGLTAVAAVIALAVRMSAASADDCHLSEQRNYQPTPQQPTARHDQQRPRKIICDAGLDGMLVGDYCVRQLKTTDIIFARVYAAGDRTIAIHALLSIQVEPLEIVVDIDSSYVGPKRYFGEARDDKEHTLIARRVLHPFPQEDDEDIPPPCVNSSYVRVFTDPKVVRSRRTNAYSFVVTDDDGHELVVNLAGPIINAVLTLVDAARARKPTR
jgi:hypothetical protein